MRLSLGFRVSSMKYRSRISKLPERKCFGETTVGRESRGVEKGVAPSRKGVPGAHPRSMYIFKTVSYALLTFPFNILNC